MSKQPAEPEDLAKLHCLNALFSPATGSDPYLSHHLKEAIDYHVTGTLNTSAPLDKFAEAALSLFSDDELDLPSYGLEHLDLREHRYDPLFTQILVKGSLKKLAGYDEALLVISGLRKSFKPKGRYWTRKVQSEYDSARNMIDKLAARWTGDYACLTLLYIG